MSCLMLTQSHIPCKPSYSSCQRNVLLAHVLVSTPAHLLCSRAGPSRQLTTDGAAFEQQPQDTGHPGFRRSLLLHTGG